VGSLQTRRRATGQADDAASSGSAVLPSQNGRAVKGPVSVYPALTPPKQRYAATREKRLSRAGFAAALGRTSAVAVLLVVVDVAAVLTAAILVRPNLGWALVAAEVLLVVRSGNRLYRRRLWLSWFRELPGSAAATAIAFALLTGILVATGQPRDTVVAVQWVVAVFAGLGEPARIVVFALGRYGRRRFDRCERALVVGAGKVGVDLVQAMLDHPEFGLSPVGIIDSVPALDSARLPAELLDEELASAIPRLRVGTVVLAFSREQDVSEVDAAITAHQHGCTTLVVPRMFELHHDGPDIERLRSYPLTRLSTSPTSRPSWWIKRVIDFVLAAVALVVMSPLIALCALAVLVESGRPVVFRQLRVGMNNRLFVLYKLRSVRSGDNDDSQTRWSVVGDNRVGPVGRFLRRTSLDELPQLWNIVRGDMSLIGPRPERPGFVQEFSAIHELYWARHRVPTGLTGLAQVHGLRGNTSIADRARYDNYYITNWSLWLDVKILLLTVGELFRRGAR
jgi:exopolysaccharide biosynthesis polyprenyl glycosylphosphotransferase